MDRGKKRILRVQNKIIIEGGVYHITQRAPGKEKVFLEESDYLKFISLLKESSAKFSLEVYAFSLLTNHLHILLRTGNNLLSKAMQELFKRYALYFNSKYERKGHVFSGRYRAALCNDADYFLTISLYIHLNAYRARIVTSPFQYHWHSLDIYVKNVKSSFVNPLPILEEVYPSSAKKAKAAYRKFVEDMSKISFSIRTMEEKKSIKKLYEEVIKWARRNKKMLLGSSKLFSNLWEIEKKMQRIKGRKLPRLPQNRKALVYLVEQLLARGYSILEISKKLGVDRVTVYRWLHSEIV